nr:glycosyltransferase [Sphingomonas lycopersici]
MPHIVDRVRVWAPGSPLGTALLYFGFIGPNKGLDHVLEVHAALRRLRPGVRLHVVGQPGSDRARSYLEGLRRRYTDDVIYHGYVTDDHLDALFVQAAHVILPYAPYRYIVPTSGSVVHALRRARVIWTTAANAMSELIVDGENGFMLTMDPVADAQRLARVIDDQLLTRRVSDGARKTALAMADFPYRRFLASEASPGRT